MVANYEAAYYDARSPLEEPPPASPFTVSGCNARAEFVPPVRFLTSMLR